MSIVSDMDENRSGWVQSIDTGDLFFAENQLQIIQSATRLLHNDFITQHKLPLNCESWEINRGHTLRKSKKKRPRKTKQIKWSNPFLSVAPSKSYNLNPLTCMYLDMLNKNKIKVVIKV